MTSCPRLYLPQLCGVLQFMWSVFSPISCQLLLVFQSLRELGSLGKDPARRDSPALPGSAQSRWARDSFLCPTQWDPPRGLPGPREGVTEKTRTFIASPELAAVCLAVLAGKFSLNASEPKSMGFESIMLGEAESQNRTWGCALPIDGEPRLFSEVCLWGAGPDEEMKI